MSSVNLFDNNIFTERFNKLIEQEKSQTAVAEKIGTKRQNIKNWKEGKFTPDITALFSICKAYNVSADWLIGITDDEIKTSDITIRAIQEYTGLSEEAIEDLHSPLSFNEVSVLNKLLTESDFDVISHELIELKNNTDLCKNADKEFNNIMDLKKYEEHKCDLLRYKLSERFIDILNLFDYRKISKEEYLSFREKLIEKGT